MAVEKTESSISTSLILVEIEGKGRGLVASQPLKGGQIILQESPILTFSAFPLTRRQQQQQLEAATYSTTYCSHCYRCFVSEGFTCPSCSHPNNTVFCSSKCQSLAIGTTHTPWVCEALSRLRHCSSLLDHQPEDCQVQACYLVAAYNLAMTSPRAFGTLLSLHGDGRKIELMEAATFLHSIISTTLSFPEGFLAFSVEMTAALLDKESCNSFSLMEPYSESGGRSARAYAVYKNASLFNHDCLPNACRFDYLDSSSATTDNHENTDIFIRMIHDVPQGTEVCLSYFRVGLSYLERKKRLLDYFGFECFCNRCKAEHNEIKHTGDSVGDSAECANHFFGRFLCEKENCGGTLAPLPPSNGDHVNNIMECNFCGNLKNDKVVNL